MVLPAYHHKTQLHGASGCAVGPKGKEVVERYSADGDKLDAFMFSPAESGQQHRLKRTPSE